jgi:hypothetical protein
MQFLPERKQEAIERNISLTFLTLLNIPISITLFNFGKVHILVFRVTLPTVVAAVKQ